MRRSERDAFLGEEEETVALRRRACHRKKRESIKVTGASVLLQRSGACSSEDWPISSASQFRT